MKSYLSDDIFTGNKIAQAVLEEFRHNTKSLKSGVPKVRSNGVHEWTVLSSIVALRRGNEGEGDSFRVLTLTTGVKAMPEAKIRGSNGMVLHDLHAEVLSLRAFNYLILIELQKVANGELSFLLTKDLKFHSDLKFAMYISEPPCGDASMELLNGAESWKRKSDGELVRGRSNFNEVGIIRTKPGRSDSLISLSKSCSDKLCSRQYYGFCNAITALLLKDNFRLDYLVLSQSKLNEASIERCFVERYGDVNLEKKIKVVPTTEEFEYRDSPDRKPCDLSLVMVSKEVGKWSWDVIGNNGLRNGRSQVDLRNASFISSASMVHYFRDLIPVKPAISSYSDLKTINAEREKAKQFIRNEVLRNKWIPNHRDDFCIIE